MLQVVTSTGQPVWGRLMDGTNVQRFDQAFRLANGRVAVGGWNEGVSVGAGLSLILDEAAGPSPQVSNSRCSSSNWFAAVIGVTGTADNGIMATGICDSGHLYALRTDPTGVVQWKRTYLISSALAYTATPVVETSAGSFVIAGGGLSEPVLLLAVDADGTPAWARHYALPGLASEVTGLVCFPNDELWLSGTNWVMAVDPSGNPLWANSYPYTIKSMFASPEENGVFLYGRSGSTPWLMRTGPQGVVLGCTSTALSPTSVSVAVPGTSTVSSSTFELTQPLGISSNTQSTPGSSLLCFTTGLLPVPAEGTAGFVVLTDPLLQYAIVEFADPLGTDDHMELIDATGRLVARVPGSGQRRVVLGSPGTKGVLLLRLYRSGVPAGVARVVVE